MIYIIDLDGTLIDSSERHSILMREILEDYVADEKISESILVNPNAEVGEAGDMGKSENEDADALAEMEAAMGDTTELLEAGIDIATNENSKKYFDAEEFMIYKADGNSGKKYLNKVLGIEDSLALSIMMKWGAEIETERMLAFDKVYEDAVPFLKSIKNKKNKVIFLTARQKENLIRDELKKLGLLKLCDKLIVVSPANAKKEKKEVVKKFVSSGKTVVVIGDTENEFELAKELELSAFILNRGFRSKAYWDKREVKSYGSLAEIELPKEAVEAPAEENEKVENDLVGTEAVVAEETDLNEKVISGDEE